ncbi:cilia- and flagella- associated protein 210 isoform X1 [Serinus canaria]|uniref:cilia- and flagella- associated protein 210 isoform X1 n=1 Tax=Serinus canaria TaxID=9135 RepID=UPI0021CC9941|nr:cilia- and flagella- associated protein 210 isoform X1 [Serinus canaria]
MAAAGRRRRGAPNNWKEKDVLDEYFLQKERDLRQVIVLPKAQWERIQGSIREAPHTAEKKQQAEVELDSKAAEKEDQRNATLSALLLTKVLKERDAQVEFLKSIFVDNKKKDYEEEQRKFKEYILSEQEKAHQHYMNKQALCKDQLQQIKEREHQADLAKEEKKREEEEIQRSIELYQLETQRKKEKEHEEKMERRKLYHAYINDQKIIKAIEEQNRMEEDERIKAHFKAKEIIAQMRKKKEAEMRRQVQEQRDKIISRLAEQMSETLRKEDDRLARDVARIEAEEEKKRKEKEAKQKAAIESIAEHRATVMKLKEEKERQEKEEAEKERDRLMEKARIHLEMENNKKHGRDEANREVQKIQLQQMAEKQARKEQEKQADLDYNAQREAIALYKEEEFQKYAKELIETESKTTQHLYPLLKACENGRGLRHRPFF